MSSDQRNRQRYLKLLARKRADGSIVTPKTADDRLADKFDAMLRRAAGEKENK